MIIRLLLLVLGCVPAAGLAQAAPAQPTSQAEASASAAVLPGESVVVVLVHGMGRTSVSILPLARFLEREGFQVLNWGYSSYCCSIAELGHQLQTDLRVYGSPAPHRVHFVGHSLGNIIIRWLLTRADAPANIGHVVMLAPPNQGSHEADYLAPYLGWLLKPLPELRTDSMSTVRALPSIANVPIGVIAGMHDGKVLVAETHLREAAHVIVPAAHTFLMFRRDVQRLTLRFLRHGDFLPEA